MSDTDTDFMYYDTEGADGHWPEDISPEDGLAVGYAPGGYLQKCNTCAGRFIGDKRARMCAKCARLAIVKMKEKKAEEVERPVSIRERLDRHMPDDKEYQLLIVEAYRNEELQPIDEIPSIVKDTMLECLLLANDVSRQLRDNDDPYERGWTDGAAKAGDSIRLAMERLGNG